MKSNLTLAIIAYNIALRANGVEEPLDKVVTIRDLLEIAKIADTINEKD